MGPEYLGTGLTGIQAYGVSETREDIGLGTEALEGTATYTFAPAVLTVPEPSTWAMMLLGFAGLGWLARLRRRKLTPA